jgi:RNA polymerase sigma factor (sigma-70 family)
MTVEEFKTWWPAIENRVEHSLGRTLARHQDRDDVLQEVGIALYLARERISSRSHAEAWSMRRGRWSALDLIEREANRGRLAAVLATPKMGIGGSPVDAAAQKETISGLDRAMEALPEMQRRVMRAVLDGCPAHEIAKSLGVSASTVRSHLRFARQRLLDLFD